MGKKKIKIGITANVDTGKFFQNGLHQNIWALAYMLQETEEFDVTLLSLSDNPPNTCIKVKVDKFSLSSVGKLDILIQGAVVIPEELSPFLKKKNIKVIVIKYGNSIGSDLTSYVHFKSNLDPKIISSSWLRKTGGIEPDLFLYSEHFKGLEQYFSCTSNVPLSKMDIAPYIWSPVFMLMKSKDKSTKYKIGDKVNKNIAMVEPSISFMKTNLIPIMISNELHKRKPGLIENCYAFGSQGIIEGKNCKRMREMLPNLPIYNDGLLKFQQRVHMVDILENMAKVLVSHQIMCSLNYTYLEFAYNKCPFVHNSKLLSNYGYYYEGFNVKDGSDRLEEALNHDDLSKKELLIYNNSCEELVWKYSWRNPKNIKGYTEKLKGVL